MVVLSGNWTLTSGRDLGALVLWAREAEDAGFDMVTSRLRLVAGSALAQLRHPLLLAAS
jgi:hypothetical protein